MTLLGTSSFQRLVLFTHLDVLWTRLLRQFHWGFVMSAWLIESLPIDDQTPISSPSCLPGYWVGQGDYKGQPHIMPWSWNYLGAHESHLININSETVQRGLWLISKDTPATQEIPRVRSSMTGTGDKDPIYIPHYTTVTYVDTKNGTFGGGDFSLLLRNISSSSF